MISKSTRFTCDKIDLLDMDESQQLAHRLGHLASAFVARAAALRDADLRPELLLIQSQTAPDFARIQDSVEEFHESSVCDFVRDGTCILRPKAAKRNTIGIIVD